MQKRVFFLTFLLLFSSTSLLTSKEWSDQRTYLSPTTETLLIGAAALGAGAGAIAGYAAGHSHHTKRCHSHQTPPCHIGNGLLIDHSRPLWITHEDQVVEGSPLTYDIKVYDPNFSLIASQNHLCHGSEDFVFMWGAKEPKLVGTYTIVITITNGSLLETPIGLFRFQSHELPESPTSPQSWTRDEVVTLECVFDPSA